MIFITSGHWGVPPFDVRASQKAPASLQATAPPYERGATAGGGAEDVLATQSAITHPRARPALFNGGCDGRPGLTTPTRTASINGDSAMEFAPQPPWQPRVDNSYRRSRPLVGVFDFANLTRPRPFRVLVYPAPRFRNESDRLRHAACRQDDDEQPCYAEPLQMLTDRFSGQDRARPSTGASRR